LGQGSPRQHGLSPVRPRTAEGRLWYVAIFPTLPNQFDPNAPP
jgi:hypothetical protein